MTSWWPALMRFLAMGLPMIPRPTNPTFSSATRSSSVSEIQIPRSHVPSPLPLGQPGEALLGCFPRRLVLQANPPVVGELVQGGEDVAVAELARTRLTPIG